MTMRAILVDDEPPARELLREYLAEFPQITVVAECGSGRAAVETVRRLEPDLLFLDVQMPGLDGLQVLEQLERLPQVVFSTAYDSFAVKAFEAGAVDYLLKPYSRERFRKAVERVLERRTPEGADADRLLALLARARSPAHLERLLVRVGERIVPIDTGEIVWIEASGDYTRLHTRGKGYLCSLGIGALEERLDPARFLRVHRSAIVALSAIEHVASDGAGGFEATMCDRSRVRVSRSYAPRIRDLIV